MGVIAVKVEKHHPHAVFFPGKGGQFGAEFLEIVEFAAAFAFQEIKVNVAVIVGQLALLAVADKTGKGAQQPNPNAPIYVSARHRLPLQAQANGGVDKEKPNVAGKAVENAPPTGFLARHTRQLSVGTVVEISPNEQQHAASVEPKIFKIEQHAGCRAEDNGKDGDDVGVRVETVEKVGPHQSERAREMYVQPFFCVLRLKGGGEFGIFFLHGGRDCYIYNIIYRSYRDFTNLWAMALAAGRRHGEKLGQSLKSIIKMLPSARTMASPP